jgi:hypothetical protein
MVQIANEMGLQRNICNVYMSIGLRASVSILNVSVPSVKQVSLEMSSLFCAICGAMWGVWEPDNGVRLRYDVLTAASSKLR